MDFLIVYPADTRLVLPYPVDDLLNWWQTKNPGPLSLFLPGKMIKLACTGMGGNLTIETFGTLVSEPLRETLFLFFVYIGPLA